MKKLWGMAGTVLFWLGWPAWAVYFHFSGVRSRVLVVCDEEILLVRGWLGTKRWSLPGGGAKKGEHSVEAAVRELREETGIIIAESSLVHLSAYRHRQRGFNYSGDIFYVNISEKPELVLRKTEIWEALWVNIATIKTLQVDDEARLAIRRYQPRVQASLL